MLGRLLRSLAEVSLAGTHRRHSRLHFTVASIRPVGLLSILYKVYINTHAYIHVLHMHSYSFFMTIILIMEVKNSNKNNTDRNSCQ